VYDVSTLQDDRSGANLIATTAVVLVVTMGCICATLFCPSWIPWIRAVISIVIVTWTFAMVRYWAMSRANYWG
jgi:fatty acid desaturase